MAENVSNDLGWFMIRGEALKEFLRRAQRGEDADLLMIEIFSNSQKQEAE